MPQDKNGTKKQKTSTLDLSQIIGRAEAVVKNLEHMPETEQESKSGPLSSEQFRIFENILNGSEKSMATFSSVSIEQLQQAGYEEKALSFKKEKLHELINSWSQNTNAEIADLYSRIKRIYSHVNMDHKSSSRMILDAILLALAEICWTRGSSVAIVPA